MFKTYEKYIIKNFINKILTVSLIFFSLIFKNFYRFYYTGKKNKKGAQTNLKYISVFSLFTVIPSLVVAIFSLFILENIFEPVF